jgi:hypothetical protein
MKKWILWGSGIFLFLIILIAALPFIFEKRIVRIVKEKINEQMEATVDFQDYKLGIFRSFPDFHLDLYELTVDGQGDFEGHRLAYIESLSMTLDIMNVIRSEKILVKKILLDKPIFKLLVNQEGKANWDIFIEEEPVITDPESEEIELAKLQYYSIKDGELEYQDVPGDFGLLIQGMQHTGTGDFSSESFVLSTYSKADAITYEYGGVKFLNKANLEADVDIDVNMNTSTYTFLENEARLNELFLKFDGFVSMPEDDIEMDMKFESQKTSFKTVLSFIPAIYMKDFDQIQTSGKVEARGVVKGVYSETKQTMPGFDVMVKVQDAWFKYPDLPGQVDQINFDLSLNSKGRNDYDDMIIEFTRAGFRFNNNPVSMHLLLKTPFSDPDIDASAVGSILLDDLGKIMPLDEGESYKGKIDADIKLKGKKSALDQKQYDQFIASGKLEAENFQYKSAANVHAYEVSKMRFLFSPRELSLPEFSMKYAESDLEATGTINNYLEYIFGGKTLTGSFNTKSDYFNLNNFMANGGSTAEDETPQVVIDIPANIDFTLQSQVDRLVYDDLEMSNVRGQIILKEKQAFLNGLNMSLLGGTLALSGSYDSRDLSKPVVDFNLDIKNWDIQQAFSKFVTVAYLAPIAKYTSGIFNTSLKYKSFLKQDMSPDLLSVQGVGNLFTKGVIVEGFEPLTKLAKEINLSQFAKQKIDNLSMYFKIEDGRFNVEPYEVKIGNSKAQLAGFTSLDQDIFYKINLEIPRSEFGTEANRWINDLVTKANERGIKADPLSKVFLDVSIDGKITSPNIRVLWSPQNKDALMSLKDELEGQVRQKAEELKLQGEKKVEEIKEDIKEKIEDTKEQVQEELNKRADQVVAEAERQADRIRKEAADLAKKIRDEGEAGALKIEKEATNPLQKAGAKIAADRLRKEANDNAARMEREANQRADKLVQDAKSQADRIRSGQEK